MRLYACLLIGLIACGGEREAGEAAAMDTVAHTAPVTPAGPPPIDSLIVGLDTAGGRYTSISSSGQLGWLHSSANLDHFRAHGHDGVAKLIECLPDQTPTRTSHWESAGVQYPRGMLCLEILQLLTDVDASRELPMNPNDLYVSRQPGDVEDELKRAQAAWRVVYDNRAYRWRVR